MEPRNEKVQVQQSDQKSRVGQRFKKVVAIEKKEIRRKKNHKGERDSSESESSVGSGNSVESQNGRSRIEKKR